MVVNPLTRIQVLRSTFSYYGDGARAVSKLDGADSFHTAAMHKNRENPLAASGKETFLNSGITVKYRYKSPFTVTVTVDRISINAASGLYAAVVESDH